MNDELEANQIYFVLPMSKLQQCLTMSDMATLAVKVSVALQTASSKDSHRCKKARILWINKSISLENYNKINNGFEYNNYGYGPNDTNKSFVFESRLVSVDYLELVPGSVRKLQRLTSRRAKMVVCSFRHRLNTIYEGTTFWNFFFISLYSIL